MQTTLNSMSDMGMNEPDTTGEEQTESLRVVDKAQPEGEQKPMRVIEDDVGLANEVLVGGKPISEYEGNEQYPADDTVVRVVFEQDLNHRIPGWEDNTERLGEFLAEFEDEWSVSIREYSYPKSRMEEIE